MKKIIIALLLAPSLAAAAWTSKIDLSPDFSPIFLRELHDGQWLAGVTKENIWHVDQNGVQRFHAGLFQAWNAEHGNASFGPIVGIDLPPKLAMAMAQSLPEYLKFASYISAAVSIDAFGGYRPIHTADVDGPWVYGIAARLRIDFGVKELQKGL